MLLKETNIVYIENHTRPINRKYGVTDSYDSEYI
jgi:hypothetical protein